MRKYSDFLIKEEKILEEDLKEIKNILQKHKQEQLLTNFDRLDKEKKKILLEQIKKINFSQMEELYKSVGKTVENKNVEIEPIPYIDKSKIEEKEKQNYMEKGVSEIKRGKLAIVTMAGGQGTRLRTCWT